MFIKNTIKNFLIIALFVSSIAISENIKTDRYSVYKNAKKAWESGNTKTTDKETAIYITAIAAACTSLVIIYKLITHKKDYKDACKDINKQYAILSKFYEDPTFTYEMLLIEARNFYYEKCLYSSTILSEYPSVWLEINIALNIKLLSNKNWKNFTYFDEKNREFCKKFDKLLNKLRNDSQFQKDKIEYNAKLRDQDFADELIRAVKLNAFRR